MCTICDKTATAPVDIDDVCDAAFDRAIAVSTISIADLPAPVDPSTMTVDDYFAYLASLD